MKKPITKTYKTIDNCEIKADIYLPEEAFGLTPIIFWIHGGALIEGSRKWIHAKQVKKYLEAGFALIAIDHRLAPETLLPEIMTDIDDAYNWIINDLCPVYNLDPEQFFVIGHSAGAFLALITGYRFSPPPKGIVSFYGYCDIAGEWARKPNAYFEIQRQVSKEKAYEFVGDVPISEGQGFRQHLYTYCRQQGIIAQVTGGFDPIKNQEQCQPYNPIENVSPAYPPTLFVHGKKDKDVPFEQSTQMSNALDNYNVTNQVIGVNGARHLFDNNMDDENVINIFNQVISFLKGH